MVPPESEGPAIRRRSRVPERLRVLLRAAREGRAASSADATAPSDARIDALHERIDRLEAMVEGLQDAVYRESVRRDERMEELHRRTEPAEIGRALNDEARRQGL